MLITLLGNSNKIYLKECDKVNNITKVMMVSVITNIFLSIMKIVSGILGRSNALIADGVHSLSDLITDFFAMIGGFLSRKPPDLKHPYGHGKIEYITSFVISLVILLVGSSVILQSYNHKIVIPSFLVICISIIAIICKYFLSHFIIRKGMQYNNQILIASGKESKTDVISSVIVFISSLLMQFSNTYSYLKYADMVATIIVGIFILYIGITILRENISYIIGEQETSEECIGDLRKIILNTEGITEIDSFILLKYGFYYKLTIVVKMVRELSLERAHKIIDTLEFDLKEFNQNIPYITIHMEPSDK